MNKIVKGYKQGKGVAFYDLMDDTGKRQEKVTKENVVKLCENGQVFNATVQWWQGKPIVRVKDTIELVKIVDGGEAVSIEKRSRGVVVHSNGGTIVPKANNDPVMPMPKITVVGKLGGMTKRRKDNETEYEAILRREREKQMKQHQPFNYSGFVTVEDMFNKIAEDFRLVDVVHYKEMVSKKVKLNQPIKSLAPDVIEDIRTSMASYLMNMSLMETRKVYEKYI